MRERRAFRRRNDFTLELEGILPAQVGTREACAFDMQKRAFEATLTSPSGVLTEGKRDPASTRPYAG